MNRVNLNINSAMAPLIIDSIVVNYQNIDDIYPLFYSGSVLNQHSEHQTVIKDVMNPQTAYHTWLARGGIEVDRNKIIKQLEADTAVDEKINLL